MTDLTVQQYFKLDRTERMAVEAEAQAQEVARLKSEFLAAVNAGDMSAPTVFAPLRRSRYTSEPLAFHYPTVGQVLLESFDYSNGPALDDALAILCAVAQGEDCTQAAKVLLERCAAKWAEMTADSEVVA
jgi:hypothetical protein